MLSVQLYAVLRKPLDFPPPNPSFCTSTFRFAQRKTVTYISIRATRVSVLPR